MTIVQKTVPWLQGYDLGIGVDLASATPMAKSVEGAATTVTGAGGATVTFQVQRIKSTSDLEQALNISADASYGSSLFGAGVEARFGFAKKCAVQTMSLFMIVTAKIDLAFLNIDSPALTSDAAAMVDRPDVFAARYGDAFVRGVARGGFYVGVMRIETQSSQDTEDISASLEGSYGLFSAQASTNFSSIESKYHAECYVDMYHEGGPPALAITDPSDPMQILNNANQFLKSFADTPDAVAVPYAATVAPIAIAQGPLPPNEVDLQHAQDVLVFCAQRRSALLDQQNLMQYIADHAAKYDFTGTPGAAAFAKAAADTQTDLDTIAACASAAINHPGSALMPKDFAAARGEAFPVATPPTPLPQATEVVLPNWVGFELQPFLFGTRDGDPYPGVPRPADLGLQIAVAQQDTLDNRLDGVIISMVPGAGASVRKGSTVNLAVWNFVG